MSFSFRCWYGHVKRSPVGQVPVYLGGSCFAWRVAMGTKYNAAGIVAHFASAAPVEHWPEWALDTLALEKAGKP